MPGAGELGTRGSGHGYSHIGAGAGEELRTEVREGEAECSAYAFKRWYISGRQFTRPITIAIRSNTLSKNP